MIQRHQNRMIFKIGGTASILMSTVFYKQCLRQKCKVCKVGLVLLHNTFQFMLKNSQEFFVVVRTKDAGF